MKTHLLKLNFNRFLKTNKLLIGLHFLFINFTFGQVTENYVMQTGNFNQSYTEKNTAPPFAGTFDNGVSEIGQFANNGSFNNTPGAAIFRDFSINGSDELTADRDLQVGDEFTITVFTAINPSAGGRIGISFRNNRNYTDFFSSTDANTVARFQLDDLGGWKIYSGNSAQHENNSATPGADRVLTIKITSTNTFNATIDGTTYYDIEFGVSGPIQSFAIYTYGDSNPDSFWKNASLTNTGSVEIGQSNTSFTLNGLVTNGLEANSNSVVSINSFSKNGSGDLTINNNQTYTGTTEINSGKMIIDATASLNSSSEITIKNGAELSLRNVQNSDDMIVESSGTLRSEPSSILTINNSLENNGSIIFESDATGSAQFDEFTGTLSGSGNITVERHIPDSNRAFRFLSTPITSSGTIRDNWQNGGNFTANVGTHITGSGGSSNGFDATNTNNPSMFTFDNSNGNSGTQNDDWQAVANTDVNSLSANTPYLLFVRGDRTPANLGAGPYTIQPTTLSTTGPATDFLTGNQSPPSLSIEAQGFSFVANPYQAVVDFERVRNNPGTSNITDFIYVRDATLGSNGGYVTVQVSTGGVDGQDVPAPPISNANNYINPGMAFFVQNDNSTSPSITFEENDKVTSQSEVAVFNETTMFYINAVLYETSELQNGNTPRDAFGLRFDSQYTTAGSLEDGNKWMNEDENIAVVNNGLKYIDNQNLPDLGHTIQLHTSGYSASDYSLIFKMENLPSGMGVFVEDTYSGTLTEITDGFVYDFTVDSNLPSSIAENRFKLVFDNTTLGVNENNFGADFSLYPNPTSNGSFSIKTPQQSGDVQVEISNLLGQQISLQKLSVQGQQVHVSAENLSNGIYVVKLSQGNQSFSAKLMVN
jgi:autotransporter-associated beta strand protein